MVFDNNYLIYERFGPIPVDTQPTIKGINDLKRILCHLLCDMSKPKKLSGIFQRKGSDQFLTTIKRFDRIAGDYKWVQVATHTSDPIKAMNTRAELQKIEDDAGAGGNSDMTRAKALAAVNSILSAHGVPEIADPIKTMAASDFIDPFVRDMTGTSDEARSTAKKRLERITGSLKKGTHLRAINRLMIQPIFDAMVGELAPSTILAHKTILKRFFEVAKADGLCSENPAARIKVVGGKREKKEPFTVSEISSILEACRDVSLSDEWRIACLFGLCLGGRLADCCKRSWSEIDLDKGVINYVPAKTSKHGTVVIAPIVNPLLSSLVKAYESRTSDKITPTLDAMKNYRRSLKFTSLLFDADIDMMKHPRQTGGRTWRKKGFHSWRHTLPTLLASAGVLPEIRMAIVGHTDKDIHMGYTHKDEGLMRAGLVSALSSLGE